MHASRRCRILHVDDDPDIREAVRSILEEEGYEVASAENGAEGLRVLGEMDRPCIILLDLMMPVLDGWGFLTQLQHSPTAANIPVAITTAYDGRAAALHLTVLRKPFVLEALLATVAQHC
jgi:CheY-like chemotaxis protein